MISLLHPSRQRRMRGMNARRRALSCHFGFRSTSFTTVRIRSASLASVTNRAVMDTVTPQSLSLFLRVWWNPVESVYARNSAREVSRKEESGLLLDLRKGRRREYRNRLFGSSWTVRLSRSEP